MNSAREKITPVKTSRGAAHAREKDGETLGQERKEKKGKITAVRIVTGLITPVIITHNTKHTRERERKKKKTRDRDWHAHGHGRDHARAGPPGLLHGRAVLTVDYPPVTHGREENQRHTAQHKTQHITS